MAKYRQLKDEVARLSQVAAAERERADRYTKKFQEATRVIRLNDRLVTFSMSAVPDHFDRVHVITLDIRPMRYREVLPMRPCTVTDLELAAGLIEEGVWSGIDMDLREELRRVIREGLWDMARKASAR